jgi:hypothetical protein
MTAVGQTGWLSRGMGLWIVASSERIEQLTQQMLAEYRETVRQHHTSDGDAELLTTLSAAAARWLDEVETRDRRNVNDWRALVQRFATAVLEAPMAIAMTAGGEAEDDEDLAFVTAETIRAAVAMCPIWPFT